MKKSPFFQNVVIITGASAGIGHQLAIQLAKQGAFLSLAARNAEKLEDTAQKCQMFGGKAIAFPTDVTDQVQCKNLVEQTYTEYGRVETLINNAGISMYARFEEISKLDLFEKIMQVNFFSSLYCTHYALPYLKEHNGRIVGISSFTGKTGVPTRSGYAASKHAMVGFFDSLRIELSDSGVNVTMIYPGFVATDMRKNALGGDGNPLGYSMVQESKIMSVETCARLILKAAAERRRELVMTFRGRVGLYLKLLAPDLVDRIAKKAIEKGR